MSDSDSQPEEVTFNSSKKLQELESLVEQEYNMCLTKGKVKY